MIQGYENPQVPRTKGPTMLYTHTRHTYPTHADTTHRTSRMANHVPATDHVRVFTRTSRVVNGTRPFASARTGRNKTPNGNEE